MSTDPTSPPAPLALARLRAQLAAPRGHARIDELLESPDPAAAVAALEPDDVYALVHAVGFEEATELMRLTTSAQIQGCLDLDGWDRDRVQLEAFRPWMAALIETGFEHLSEVFSGLDNEIQALIFQDQTLIHDLTLGEEPDDTDDRPLHITSDRFFAIRLTGDEDVSRLTMQAIEDLYRGTPEVARHALQMARSELGAEIEEEAYRWRCARMADLGYVDFYEALELFRPLEPGAVGTDSPSMVSNEPVRALPSVVLDEVLGKSFLARALSELSSDDAARVETELLLLVNRVLAAGRAKPGQPEVLARGARYATATLALGLELVSKGDLARAADTLRTVALQQLFRVGYTRPLQLAKLAASLAPRSVCAGSPAAEVVSGLCSPRPLLARVVDVPPAAGLRPFESQRDLRACAEVLAELTVRVALVEDLGINVLAMAQLDEPRPELDDHLRTAAVRILGGGEYDGAALTQAELTAARSEAFDDKHLGADARIDLQTAFARRLEAAGLSAHVGQSNTLAIRLADEIEAILGPLTDATIDPRFVTGLLVAKAHS